MKNVWILIVIIALIGVGVMAFANGNKPPATASESLSDSEDNQITQHVMVPGEVAEGPIKIRGVLEKTEEGLSLFDGRDTYALADVGSVKGLDVETVEKMVGTQVVVGGDLEKSDAGPRILVKEMVAYGG